MLGYAATARNAAGKRYQLRFARLASAVAARARIGGGRHAVVAFGVHRSNCHLNAMANALAFAGR